MSTPADATKGGLAQSTEVKRISLDVLTVVKSSQTQYGLRHSDYQRYRNYCTRRLARIRKTLEFTHGSEKRYLPKPISPDTVKNADFLLIVLFKAERAWSYGMQLKQDMEIQTKNTRLRHHLVRRQAKASKWAALLEKLCIAVADERTALEAEAYAAWMGGLTALEREQWEPALDAFVKSRTIYDQIGSVADYDLKEMYKQRVEEIDPSIRYCNYNLKKEKGVTPKGEEDTRALVEMTLKGNELLSSKLDSVLNEARKKHAEEINEITWKGRPLPIKNEKLQVLLLSANEALSELEKASNEETKMPLYDKLYAAYADALVVIKEEIATVRKANQGKSKTGGKVDAQEQNLLYLQEYVTYLKISATIQRSVSIADSAASGSKATGAGGKKKHLKPDDIVRLYDGIVSNVIELRDMLASEENAEKAKELGAQLVTFKAYRCYWLALSFATAGKSQESLALFDRASSHSSTARKQHEAIKPANAQEIARLDILDKLIRGSRSKSHAKAFLTHMQKQEAVTKGVSDLSLANTPSRTLAQNLHNYDTSFLAEKKIVDLPPDYEAIPVKPLLFDMAFESCEFPDLEARKKTKAGGFFRNIFGR